MLLCLGLLPGRAVAQTALESPLPLDGTIAADGRSVTLDWFDAVRPRVGSVQVNRRHLGDTGAGSWITIAPDLGVVRRFTDTTTQPGVAYEYRVQRIGRDVVDVGYWTTGVDLPAVPDRGIAHVVVDQSLSVALDAHLRRFVRNLTGDGWRVEQITAPRGDATRPGANLAAATALRTRLQQAFQQDPAATHAVILVGHVPIVTSGRVNPDGHDPVPHATDLFYGDMDGVWPAGPDGVLGPNALPSDAIEMQVGRIDFAPLAQGAAEAALLRAYFDKNHHWRTGLLGDLRTAYGQSGHLETEIDGLRNIVGPDAITAGGHHDVGEARPWLWGVDFGDFQGRRYAAAYANKAVFAINFGSHKQKFDQPHNAMTALLAQPFYPLAVSWGGRPAWWLHPMALGATIGEIHLRTVNNGVAGRPYRASMDYWPTGRYIWRNPVWVNLLGDPTLHAFVLAPPTALRAQRMAQGVTLRWTAAADPDVQGYAVWRRTDRGPMVPLAGAAQIAGTQVADLHPVAGATYMVRALGRKTVHAGSFRTLSQGVFARVDHMAQTAGGITLTTSAGQAVALPAAFAAPQNGVIHAVIAPPGVGDLRLDEAIWRYVPPAGFSGTVAMTYARSDDLQTQVGPLTIIVTPAPAGQDDQPPRQ
jgi:hypothetical protein